MLKTKFTFMLVSNVKNRMAEIILFFVSIIYFTSCTSFRSAEGLNGGEVNVTYIAPLAGAVRVGVTDNIEARAMVIGNGYRADIFLHTKKDSGKVNFGITLGSQFVAEQKPAYYTLFTVGGRSGRFNKYLSLGYYHKNISEPDKKEITFGSEIEVYVSETSSKKIIVTPEVSVLFPAIRNDVIKTPVYGSVSIGYTFNFLELIK